MAAFTGFTGTSLISELLSKGLETFRLQFRLYTIYISSSCYLFDPDAASAPSSPTALRCPLPAGSLRAALEKGIKLQFQLHASS